MKRAIVVLLLFGLAVGCRRAGPSGDAGETQQYPLTGQILSIPSSHREVTVKHQDIPGFMPAMTMAYPVKDASLLNGLEAGDLITATLNVRSGEPWLTAIKKTGHAPVPTGGVPTKVMDVMEPGDTVPSDALVDQDGRQRSLSDWKGQALAVTFIYTRCPLPDFCPLMDRQFAETQKAVQADPALRGHVHLVTITFDPEHDTPAVLKTFAKGLSADPAVWTFLTGKPETVAHVAERFGVSVLRDPSQAITHTLRTEVADRQGRITTVYTGNEWTVPQLVDALKHALAQ